MAATISLERMALLSARSFLLAAETFRAPEPPEEARNGHGWLSVTERFASRSDEASLQQLAQDALTTFLTATGLPVDFMLADAAYAKAWQAAVVCLHGLLVCEEDDEEDDILKTVAQWIEEHAPQENAHGERQLQNAPG